MPNPVPDVQNVDWLREDFKGSVQQWVASMRSSNTQPATTLSGKRYEVDKQQYDSIQKILQDRGATILKQGFGDFDINSEVKIGVTRLTVPPENIRVQEARFNEEIPGLRTTANALVKTGRGQIKIDMKLSFPSVEAINEELREIVAQFRAAPFLPIESAYIFNAILAKSADLDPDELQRVRGEHDDLVGKYKKLRDEIIELLMKETTFHSVAYEWTGVDPTAGTAELAFKLRDYTVAQLVGMIQNWMAYTAENAVRPRDYGRGKFETLPIIAPNTAFEAYEKIREKGMAARQLVPEVRTRLKEMVKRGYPQSNSRPIVPVVLHTMEIKTVPGETDSLEVNLSCIYFAYEAYVPFFLYKDAQGAPTLDIEECPFFWDYVRSRYLDNVLQGKQRLDESNIGYYALDKYKSSSAARYEFKYPTSNLELVKHPTETQRGGVPPDIPIAKVWGGVLNLIGGQDAQGRFYVPKQAKLLIDSDDPNIIPQQVIIRIQNRIAVQPIQGSLYATAQHLGTINARVALMCAVVGGDRREHDKAVARIQAMKLESERVALMLGPRHRRAQNIVVDNPILGLLGIRSVQIDGIMTSTVPGETNSSMVRLDMVEYTVTQDKREALQLAREGKKDGLYKTVLRVGSEMAADFINGNDRTPQGALVHSSQLGEFCMKELLGGLGQDLAAQQKLIEKERAEDAYNQKLMAAKTDEELFAVLAEKKRKKFKLEMRGTVAAIPGPYTTKGLSTGYPYYAHMAATQDRLITQSNRPDPEAGKYQGSIIDEDVVAQTIINLFSERIENWLNQDTNRLQTAISLANKPGHGRTRKALKAPPRGMGTSLDKRARRERSKGRDDSYRPNVVQGEQGGTTAGIGELKRLYRAGSEMARIANVGQPNVDPHSEHIARMIARECIEHWRMLRAPVDEKSENYLRSMEDQFPDAVSSIFRRFPNRGKRDTRKIIEIPPDPTPWLDEIFGVLKDDSYRQNWAQFMSFSEFMRANVGPLREEAEKFSQDLRRWNNYPDMDLPTYRRAFLDPDKIEPRSDSNFEGRSTIDKLYSNVLNFGRYGPSTKEFLKRFFDTYRDLGKRHPVRQGPDYIARTWDDIVDPDWYYFHRRLAAFYESIGEAKDGPGSVAEAVYRDSSLPPYVPDQEGHSFPMSEVVKANRVQKMRSNIHELRHVSVPNRGAQNESRQNLDLKANLRVLPPRFRVDSGTLKGIPRRQGFGTTNDFDYKPGHPMMQKILGQFVHDRPHHLRNLYREIWATKKDDMHRMIRAFPTFKLEFIEEDDDNWGYWDDFYGYNSVASIRMSEHKFEPTLLEIKLINTTGNLDKNRSKAQDPDRRAHEDPLKPTYDENGNLTGIDDTRAAPNSQGVEASGESKFLTRFYLRVGTQIRLKLGYGSNDDQLEVKFTGQVVEVQYGDIITIICQSYKNQLAVPLNTFKDGTDADPYWVVDWVMKESPTDAFGKFNPYASGLLPGMTRDGSNWYQNRYDRVRFWGYRGDQAQEQFDQFNKFLGIIPFKTLASMIPGPVAMKADGSLNLADLIAVVNTRKMSNVYLPRRSCWYEITGGSSEKFIIPDRTGLEVLHELTRHLPGWVFDVRPYDHHCTLFFGKPEQRYFYTDERQDEERIWNQFRADRFKKLTPSYVTIMKQFIKSQEFQFARTNNGRKSVTQVLSFTSETSNWLQEQAKIDEHPEEIWATKAILSIPELFDFGVQRKIRRYHTYQRDVTRRASIQDVNAEFEGIEENFTRTFSKLLVATFFNYLGNVGLQGLLMADRAAELKRIEKEEWVQYGKDITEAAQVRRQGQTTQSAFQRHGMGTVEQAIQRATRARIKEKQAKYLATDRTAPTLDDLILASAFFLEDDQSGELMNVQERQRAENYIDIIRERSNLDDTKVFDAASMPGNILTSMDAWRDKITIMLGPIVAGETGRGTNWDALRNVIFAERTDGRWYTPLQDKFAGHTRTSRGGFHQIDRAAWSAMVSSIMANLDAFKTFVVAFHRWMSRKLKSGNDVLIREMARQCRQLESLGDNPRTKSFRNYHFVNAQKHIIKNGIIATKEQMANSVILKYPNSVNSVNAGDGRVLLGNGPGDWSTMEWMANENIYPSEKKVRLVTEINAVEPQQAQRTAFSNLAEALRPMYRGELILRGNPNIKPYDIIYITDPYESMYGMVEVERVITNFDPEVGYTTTVIPHLLTIPQSNSSWIAAQMAGIGLGFEGLVSVAAIAGGSGLLGGAGGAGLGALFGGIPGAKLGALGGGVLGFFLGGYVSWNVTDLIFEEAHGAGLWGVLTGKGRFGNMTTPVDVLPLVRAGHPFTAGLRGWGNEGWQVRLLKRWANIIRGGKIVLPVVKGLLEDVQANLK